MLTVKTVDALVGDTMRTIVYLIADGFELAKNEEKKLVIRKIGGPATKEEEVILRSPQEDINVENIPLVG